MLLLIDNLTDIIVKVADVKATFWQWYLSNYQSITTLYDLNICHSSVKVADVKATFWQ